MATILTLLLPFFGLIALGYGAGRLRFVTEDGLAGIDFFVFYCALPVLFFHMVATAPLSGRPRGSSRRRRARPRP